MESDSDDGFGTISNVGSNKGLAPGDSVVELSSPSTSLKRKQDSTLEILDRQMASAVNREWQTLVSSSIVLNKKSTLQLPWERGFAGKVFGKETVDIQVCLPVPVDRPSWVDKGSSPSQSSGGEELVKRINSVPGAWNVISTRLAALSFHKNEDEKRQIALAKWSKIFRIAPEKSKLGRKLLTELLAFSSDGYLDQIMQDVFAKKATSTLGKRADNLLEFFSYCTSSGLFPIPLMEEVFYRFLREVRAQASPTGPKSSLEAIAFSEIFGFDGAGDVLDSARIKGLCHRLQLTKRPTKQSKLLLRIMLVALERIMHDPSYWIADRVKAAHDLFTIYSRLRWNDSMWLSSTRLDKDQYGNGFLESETLVTKTSNTARKKTTFLPVVTPIQLLETADFGTVFLELRRKANLPDIGTKDDNGNLLPSMPTVDRHGKFTTVPLSSSDAGKWLRELLTTGKHAVSADVTGITSHGLKATTLAWAAKHGGVSPYERKLLGYHADKSEDSMHTYSRDTMAVPMRKYAKIIEDVAFGVFDPDATRSGHFKPSEDSKKERRPEGQELSGKSPLGEWEVTMAADNDTEMPDLDEEVLAEDEPEKLEVASDVSDESSNGSSSEEEDEDYFTKDLPSVNEAEDELVRKGSKSVGMLRFVHIRLKTVHAGHSSNFNKLACGRPLTSGFKYLDDPGDSFPYPRCSDCFGKSGAAGQKN